jgi:hypothetical protein
MSLSISVAAPSTSAVSSSVAALSSTATGGSFTGVTVIETTASSVASPSETRKRTESGPW